ncbi:MAG: QueT transporter family protein, partial [Clostridia bacterium]|nr:QueT transporter family protein [Clostridia bacterium]
MKQFFTAKRLCRAGVVSALYVALTYAFGALSYQGFMEIRPAEALCILPLIFPEAVPAL